MSSETLNPRDECWQSRVFADDVIRSTTKTKNENVSKQQEIRSKNPDAIRFSKCVSGCQNPGIQQGGDPLPVGSGDEISELFNFIPIFCTIERMRGIIVREIINRYCQLKRVHADKKSTKPKMKPECIYRHNKNESELTKKNLVIH
jgi:hypothetical protein